MKEPVKIMELREKIKIKKVVEEEQKKEIIKIYSRDDVSKIIASEQMEFLMKVEGGIEKMTDLREKIRILINKAWAVGSVAYGIQDAIDWGKDFIFPRDIGMRDALDLKNAGSLSKLCLMRHGIIAEKRLSADRVRKVVTERRLQSFDGKMDKLRAIDIAEFGMVIPVSDVFRSSSERPPLRKKYLLVQGAVNKIIYEMYNKGGTVLLLPTEVAIKIPGVHFSSQHWTTKKEKACGRSLGDASNDTHGNALNDALGVVQGMVRKLWGEVIHPTLEDLVSMIVRTAQKYGWENIVLWKMDLKGAFSLLRIHEADVCKLAFELTDGITL